MGKFERVKHHLLDWDFDISHEDKAEQLLVVSKEDEGIKNMVVDCEGELLIIEQYLFPIKHDSSDVYKHLLMKNRDLVHGALVLDTEGKKVLFRDTLQLENLNENELEASINSLSMFIAENFDDLLAWSK